MIPRLCLVLVSALMLSACASLDGMFASEDMPALEPVATVQAPAPATPALDEARCQRVAASDRLRAQANGFDPATLDRMTLTSFQQCRFLTAQ